MFFAAYEALRASIAEKKETRCSTNRSLCDNMKQKHVLKHSLVLEGIGSASLSTLNQFEILSKVNSSPSSRSQVISWQNLCLRPGHNNERALMPQCCAERPCDQRTWIAQRLT